MLDVETERKLIAQAKAGTRSSREAAFREIFAALCRPVFGLCRNLTGNTAEAEDVLQEVFIEVHRALPHFRGDARLSTWVHRIAIRTALRTNVRRRRRATMPLDFEPAARTTGDPVAAEELTQGFGAALAGLPFAQRVVLSLFSVEGLSHAEIAEVLGVPVGTVWSRLHVARKRLVEELEPLLKSRPGANRVPSDASVGSQRQTRG